MSDTFFIEAVVRWSDADLFLCFDGDRNYKKAEDGREIGVLENSDGVMAHRGMLEWMAKGGVPFYGYHLGQEGYFNAYLFASDGEKYAEIESDAVENVPVVSVDDNGEPYAHALDNARAYLATLAKAKELVGVQSIE